MSISIKDVVAITGTPGLFKILKSDDRSLIVESIDEHKKRRMIPGTMMVSKLADVSIYTTEDSEPLVNILKSAKEKYADGLPVTKKSSNAELMDFLESVLPSYDKEKVYPSNVKKLIGWFNILEKNEVDFTIEEEEENKEEEKTEKKTSKEEDENAAVKEEKKAPAKKAAAKKKKAAPAKKSTKTKKAED